MSKAANATLRGVSQGSTTAQHQPDRAPAPHLRGKRVAMVLFSFYPDDARPRRAAEALVACGMHVDLVCLRENSADRKIEVWNGVRIRRVPMTRRRGGVLGYVWQYAAFLLAS